MCYTGIVCKMILILPSESTSYASDISLKRLFASSKLFGFLSGCHFKANFLYLKKKEKFNYIYLFNREEMEIFYYVVILK